MIPTIIMVLGALIFLFSLVMLVRNSISPLVVRWRNTHGEVELISTDKINLSRKKDRTFFYVLFTSTMTAGLLMFCFGFSLGYADKGEGFWFYHLVEGDTVTEQKWDRISDEGDFIADDGRKYPYYLLVRGNEYEFRGKSCENIDAVREQISRIPRENTVMIIDSYAVSQKVKDAEKLLKEMGIQYETEEV